MAAKETDTQRPNVPVVRIFLSSPGDVAEERAFARELIDSELMKRPHLRGRGALELIAWDDPAAPIPMLATETPQESVNAARPRPANCDIVIVLLWSRMGTLLPDRILKPDGTRYLSGTEWEYEDAVKSTRQPRPQVLIYRRTEKLKLDIDDPDFDEKRTQFRAVNDFFDRFRNPDGSLNGGFHEHATAAEFKELLRQHLDEFLHRLLPPAAMGGDSKAPFIQPVIPPAYLEWLQRTCADVSLLGQDIQKGQAITLSQIYVPALTRPVATPEVAARGKARARPEAEEKQAFPLLQRLDGVSLYIVPARGKGRARPAADEKQAVPLLQRMDGGSLYVPAPAGAGKSTFCRWAVLQSIATAPIGHAVPAPDEFAEPEPKSLRGRLPLLVPLRDFGTDMDCGRGGRTWHRGDLEDALATWADRLEGLSAGTVKAHIKAGSAFLLLDGLDEVPVSDTREGHAVFPRELLLSGLADALPEWLQAGNRILLTSRPYGLDEAGLHRLRLPQAPLEPLPRELQDLFVTRWFHTLGRPEKTEDLIATIRQRENLAPLVENPMLLTALCVLHESGGRLPEDRYELYKRIVNNVLFHRFHDEVRQREPARARLEAIALGMHVGDPDSPRQSPVAEISYLEVEQLLRAFAKEDSSYERGRVEPVAQRDELLTRSGLLLPRENYRAAFYHLSVQEYLAAERILRLEDDLWPIFRDRSAVAEWRATLMFLFAGKIAGKSPRWGTDMLQRLLNEQERSAVEANPWPAAFIAEALEMCLAKDYSVPEILKEGFRRLALNAIVDEVAVQARHALGLCLGRVGDPRFPSLRDTRAYVEVPAGTYPYGNKGEKVEIEAPFRLGRYPVTNSQYRVFLEDGGYAKREYWSEAGWAWLQKNGVTEPEYWHDRRWNGPNQPVVGVSFWEAEACCAWAGGRLPTEQEWEAAARGPDGLTYPWGNDWEDGICNSSEASLDVTSTVGLFPRARQRRFGIEDLVGNVWEWCDSLYDADDKNCPDLLVLRGGSYLYGSWGLRASFRFGDVPDFRFDEGYGFRCVLAPPRP
ncbi:Sulphatase-modifying factor protein [Candidatus Defluviicoccus seviourii]|uniref:Sulphatase-modifying factor protein n=2 Tax=root TaxID=1 RepID=A0A564WIZ3_9PROT|nr:Sulphatase-modifying factor protein [uncultured Defluviicoccus sp.]VUX47534.1 Sulphatase-modifying factor protein [Candidatus Defluviicoccus seviourii]